MAQNRWLVLPVALLIWILFFYGVDIVVMEGQRLPVAWEGSVGPSSVS